MSGGVPPPGIASGGARGVGSAARRQPAPRETGDHRVTVVVVEVADSSLPQDRLTKAHIYAGAGVPEYWIVDLVHERLEVFRDPQPEARRYASKMVLEAGARAELVALPGAVVSTDDLLPPPADT